MTNSVVQEWLAERCTFKQQTVLLCALRGCDGIPKEDAGKIITRKLRSVVLNSAHYYTSERSFMSDEVTKKTIQQFLGDIDKYPIHWFMHLAHAAEIIGFKHPDILVAGWWQRLYYGMCDKLHVNPESETQLDKRLADYL